MDNLIILSLNHSFAFSFRPVFLLLFIYSFILNSLTLLRFLQFSAPICSTLNYHPLVLFSSTHLFLKACLAFTLLVCFNLSSSLVCILFNLLKNYCLNESSSSWGIQANKWQQERNACQNGFIFIYSRKSQIASEDFRQSESDC